MSFKDKVVLITGGSSGIGAATAIKFVEEGAQVAIVGRNQEKLEIVSEKCEKNISKPLVIIADLTKDDDVKRIVNETINAFGKLDVLINNAGIVVRMGILNRNALETFDRIMATNLRAVVHLMHYAASHLIKSKGNIINISSVAGMGVLTPTSFIYPTSKAGLNHFTKCIAMELSSKGVRVNSVNPGPVKTPIFINAGLPPNEDEAFWEGMAKETALNRISDPDEVADLVVYLASDKARSITGAAFVTDNGYLLKGCKKT